MEKIAVISIVMMFLIGIPLASAAIMGDFNLPLDWILMHNGTSVDQNINGIIDLSEDTILFGGQPPSYYLNQTGSGVNITYLEANYYNITQVDANITAILQLITDLNNTKAGIGSCSPGYVVSGTTTSGVTCVPQSNGTNVTGTLAKYVGQTAGLYTGNITSGAKRGYDAANDLCNIAIGASHMCTSEEILNTIRTNITYTGTGWIANGPPGYTSNSNDCKGFTSQAANYLGAFWNWDDTIGGGAGYLTACNGQKHIYCCG